MNIITKILKVGPGTSTKSFPKPGPAWRVEFEVEGGARFEVDSVMQHNEPQLEHLQREAAQRPDYFWKFWAKPLLLF